MILSRTLLFALLLPAAVLGFLGLPALRPVLGTSSTSDDTCPSNRVAAFNRRHADTVSSLSASARNIFHEYDKPLVLLGFSSKEGNELFRLAESIASSVSGAEVFPQGTDTYEKFSKKEQLDAWIEGSRWPNVVVLDWNKEGHEPPLEIQMMYQEVAKNLYDRGFLAVYVNVDTSSTKMDAEEVDRKQMLDDVFVQLSDYELCIQNEGLESTAVDTDSDSDEDVWEHIEWELTRILARAKLLPAIPGDQTRSVNTAHLTMGEHTFFLSLSFPDIKQVEPYVNEMCRDVDAMEYRADLLECRDSRFDLIYGMQLLRKYCRRNTVRVPALPFDGSVIEDAMPILFTVRTQNQSGTYPDDKDGIAKMFELLKWGLRGGVEVLDVESAWDPARTAALLDVAEERYSSQILGSHHVVGKEVEIEDAVLLFEQCALEGRAHGAKVVLSIDSDEKDRMAYEAALITSELAVAEGKPVIPNVSLILGDVGQFSRVINLPFTPVTHESLPFKAAPGQLTSNEIMMSRLASRIFQRKKYAILGHNIAYSVSPQMHGAAFAATRLPNEYVRVDVATVEEFIESDLFKSDDFGGTSVTIPHKQAIIPFVDVLSEAARAIGSVNTVVAKDEFEETGFKRVIYGDNTDWKGIYNPLKRLLGGSVDESKDCALILGAGGTARAAAYVAEKLGLKRVYFNRTPSKAKELANTFGGDVITSLDEFPTSEGLSLGEILGKADGLTVRVVISTLPAAAEFELPEWLIQKATRPIVFDVNYKPFNTALLRQAEAKGCKVVRGSEMLWEQGVGQFELWTQRTAPYSVMKQVVLQNCQESVESTGLTKDPVALDETK